MIFSSNFSSVDQFQPVLTEEPPRRAFAIGDDTCFVGINGQPPIFSIRFDADTAGAAELPLADKIDSLWGNWPEDAVPRERLTFEVAGAGFNARIIFGELNGRSVGDSISLYHASAYVLVSRESALQGRDTGDTTPAK